MVPVCIAATRLSFTLWYNFNKRRPLIMQFSSNGSQKTLVFCDVKMLGEIQRHHPQREYLKTVHFALITSGEMCR